MVVELVQIFLNESFGFFASFGFWIVWQQLFVIESIESFLGAILSLWEQLVLPLELEEELLVLIEEDLVHDSEAPDHVNQVFNIEVSF